MIYRSFQDKSLSLLGFGAMRLPTMEDGSIDELQTQRMVDYAMEHGVNYFDTAYPYHNGHSERVLGRALKRYDRESFYLATKFPGHQISSSYDPKAIFEEQLEKCGVDYFDFYLLHNVYEKSIDVYLDPKWGILDYFREQKRLGRIKHLGFSTHARMDTLRTFLDACGRDMEFCQIQLNYLDWTLQDGKEKCELLDQWGIPVWVMEPVRGGKLAAPGDGMVRELKQMRPDEGGAAWCFRFLQGLSNVKMILSGMSNMEQMMENVATFEQNKPLSEEELTRLLELAEGLKNSIPCTACRYCCDGCPAGLDIPMLLSVYNDVRVSPVFTVAMGIEALPEEKRPGACISCGKCTRVCPQNIDIPKEMKDFTAALSKIPSWEAICREREEAARRK